MDDLLAEIQDDQLPELLSLELKSPERRESHSAEDLEEVGYDMDFRGEL